MKLKITLESYTLCGSGEGAGLIDSDVIFDAVGFPYLPGRRIKGLLRESAQEVLEILGMEDGYAALLHGIFGNGGFLPGKIRIPSLNLPDYDMMVAFARQMLGDKKLSLVTRAKILAAFTDVRTQTAVDEDGIANESSLRVTRVLGPGLMFVSDIGELPEPETALLFLAAINLRRMGTARNRGQGKIICSLEGSSFESVKAAIAGLTLPVPPVNPAPVCHIVQEVADSSQLHRLSYTVTLKSPLVITKPLGDENTVSTNDYLPGNIIRGVVAKRIMDKCGLSSGNAHEDVRFYSLILDQAKAIVPTPAFPTWNHAMFCHTPMCLHTDKGDVSNLVSLLDDTETRTDTRYQKEMLSISAEQSLSHGVAKTLFFHTTRGDNRIQGKSDDGGIFFYEAIDSGQEFTGWIWGTRNTLDALQSLTGSQFDAAIGRSRSAQYGVARVELGLLETDEPDFEESYGGDEDFLLSALSPIIFYNESGMAEVGTARLEAWLTDWFEAQVTVFAAFARMAQTESYVGVWGIKTPRDAAYEEGSTFLIHVAGLDPETRVQKVRHILKKGLGDRTDAGMGRVRVLNFDDFSHTKIPPGADGKPYPQTMPTVLKETISTIVKDEIRNRIMEKGIQEAAEYQNRPLTNHQIGRLEQMITRLDRNTFISSLENFRDASKKQLENCKNNARLSILDSLKGYEQPIRDKIENLVSNELRHVMIRSGLQKNDVVNLEELTKDYWVSLLRKMRKDNRGRRSQ